MLTKVLNEESMIVNIEIVNIESMIVKGSNHKHKTTSVYLLGTVDTDDEPIVTKIL